MSEAKQQSLPPGYRLAEFEIIRELGSGGFGITYLAHDHSLERQVVIKENLPLFAFRDPSTSTVHPKTRKGEDNDIFEWSLESFVREARTLAKFDHPNIVKILRVFNANGTAYFVMPYVEGLTFAQLVERNKKQNRPFPEEELCSILLPLLDALEILHGQQVYHRDIKPGNLLITSRGTPVLIDFGAARQMVSERSQTVMESPGYTPFEQLQSRGNVGPWSDLYGLAATFYKALTFENPPKANDRVRRDPTLRLTHEVELQKHYSGSFLHALDHAFRFDEEDRPQSVAEWRDELLRRSGSESVIVTQEKTDEVSSTELPIPPPSGNEGESSTTSVTRPGSPNYPDPTEPEPEPDPEPDPEPEPEPEWDQDSEPVFEQGIAEDACVVLSGSDDEGNEFRIEFNISDLVFRSEGMIIGRSSKDTDLVLDSSTISRRHACLTYERISSRLLIADLDSGNGTWVDGERVTESTSLVPGQTLVLGMVGLSVESFSRPSTGKKYYSIPLPQAAPNANSQPSTDAVPDLFQGTLLVRLTLFLGLATSILVPACLSGRFRALTDLPFDDGLLIPVFWFVHSVFMYRVYGAVSGRISSPLPSPIKAVLWTLIPGWNIYWIFQFYSLAFRGALIGAEDSIGNRHKDLPVITAISLLLAAGSFLVGHVVFVNNWRPPNFLNGVLITQVFLGGVAAVFLWRFSRVVAERFREASAPARPAVTAESLVKIRPRWTLWVSMSLGTIIALVILFGETQSGVATWILFAMPCLIAAFGIRLPNSRGRAFAVFTALILAASFGGWWSGFWNEFLGGDYYTGLIIRPSLILLSSTWCIFLPLSVWFSGKIPTLVVTVAGWLIAVLFGRVLDESISVLLFSLPLALGLVFTARFLSQLELGDAAERDREADVS